MARKRIDQDFEARRDQLLDAAWNMLVTDGYAALTLNRFLNSCGVSKGAFYHYFDSWNVLLEQVMLKVASAAVAEMEHQETHLENAPVASLNRLIGLSPERPQRATLLRRLLLQIHRTGDLMLATKLLDKSTELSVPIVERMIRDGVSTGVFDTPFPTEVAETVLRGWNHTLLRVFATLNGDQADESKRGEILHTVDAMSHMTERLLGMKPGLFERASGDDVDRIIRLSRRAE